MTSRIEVQTTAELGGGQQAVVDQSDTWASNGERGKQRARESERESKKNSIYSDTADAKMLLNKDKIGGGCQRSE